MLLAILSILSILLAMFIIGKFLYYCKKTKNQPIIGSTIKNINDYSYLDVKIK